MKTSSSSGRSAPFDQGDRQLVLVVRDLLGLDHGPDDDLPAALQRVPELLAPAFGDHEAEGRAVARTQAEAVPADLVAVELGMARGPADEPGGAVLLDAQPAGHLGRTVDQQDLALDVLVLVERLAVARPHVDELGRRVGRGAAGAEAGGQVVEVGDLEKLRLDGPQLGRLGVPGRPAVDGQIEGRGVVEAVLAELLQDEGRFEITGPVLVRLAVAVDPGQMDLVLEGHLARGFVDDGPQDGRRARRRAGRGVLGGGRDEPGQGEDDEGGEERSAVHDGLLYRRKGAF